MPLNPSLRQETLNNPIQRGNPLNDPKYQEQQGYNNYDLNNSQLCTPRFGEVTPTTVFETVPGDRHLLHGNALSILNQIDANLVTEVNAYMDYFFVPMRCVFPVNYEKIVPNPTKGDDLPIKALPQIPFLHLLREMLVSNQQVIINSLDGSNEVNMSMFEVYDDMIPLDESNYPLFNNQVLYVAYTLSRGNLMDYLGYCIDTPAGILATSPSPYAKYQNKLQKLIDEAFHSIANFYSVSSGTSTVPVLLGKDIYSDDSWSTDKIDLSTYANPLDDSWKIRYIEPVYVAEDGDYVSDYSLSGYRAALYDAFEKGLFVVPAMATYNGTELVSIKAFSDPESKLKDLYDALVQLLYIYHTLPLESDSDPFNVGFINPLRPAAYQLSVAEYMSNDSVDNIFSAELYMQNLRSLMFPAQNGITSEPTFDYNGVSTEYDLLTTGAFEAAFFSDRPGFYARVLPVVSSLFFLRRSLRYGDYFATGRPNLLAVGQLGIPVENNSVKPIDVSKNLVLQRFLNAVNWVGSRFVNYMTSIFGVKPSNTGVHPVFLAHRKTPLNRDVVTNTAQDQGKQVTNLRGETDDQAFDVFIDDFGCIIGVNSFDILPSYPSGIDANFQNSDRYSMFNSMLQNVGDQGIKLSELTGVVGIPQTESAFAYTVRYAQYKFGISRAHGAFVNSLPGFAMLYPWATLSDDPSTFDLKINPDFIRDKPFYFDQFFEFRTGMSPADYFHFIVAVTNQHSAARKMQYQPPVL